jgi:hypothetical protein
VFGLALGFAACLLALTGALRAEPGSEAAPGPSLVNPDQIARERMAVRIMGHPAMRAALRRTEERYAADPQAKTPAGAVRRRLAARAIAVSATHYAIGLAHDPLQPQLFWCCKMAQKLGSFRAPGSGYGIDNPDNVYRITHVDGRARYRISGGMLASRTVQLHIEVRDAIPGTTAMNAEGGVLLATLRDDEMSIAPDGRFIVTIDSDPAGMRANHLQIPADGTFHVVLRDLLGDWQTDRPVPLAIERLSSPDQPFPPETEIAAKAAALLDQIGPFWLDFDNRYLFSRPANTIASPRLRPSGRGMAASGHFALPPGQALVITADPLGARSLGIQLTDPWGVAYDYINRTSSLNHAQSRANADGTISWVIAARDPGFANWLDPGGHPNGIVTLRWQGLIAGTSPESALRSVAVVPLAQIRQHVPQAGTGMWLTPAERRQQRDFRRESHALGATPAANQD